MNEKAFHSSACERVSTLRVSLYGGSNLSFSLSPPDRGNLPVNLTPYEVDNLTFKILYEGNLFTLCLYERVNLSSNLSVYDGGNLSFTSLYNRDDIVLFI